jgi:hypothetical protein
LDVEDFLVLHETALALELGEAGVGDVVADHRSPVGDRHEERAGVEIARQRASVDLERRLARVRQVHREAVVHDAFEDGQRSYPHGIEEHAIALADAIEAALPQWVRSCTDRFGIDAGDAPDRATADLMPRIRELLAQDIDAQRTTPLSLLREAARYPTEVLRAAGVAPVGRDDHDRAMFPDDDYGLTPASFADFGDDVSSAGIAWGAAKAWTHRQRHS